MNELDLIKLNIFEAYDNGEITYGEKEYLLEQVDYMYESQSKSTKEIRRLLNKYKAQINGNALQQRAAADTKAALLRLGVNPDMELPSKREIRTTGAAAKAAGKAAYKQFIEDDLRKADPRSVSLMLRNKKASEQFNRDVAQGAERAGQRSARNTSQAATMKELKNSIRNASGANNIPANADSTLRRHREQANLKNTGSRYLSGDTYMHPKDVPAAQKKFKDDYAKTYGESVFDTLLESIDDLYYDE